jgi:hypothetical protein
MENLMKVKGIDAPMPQKKAKDSSGRMTRQEAEAYEIEIRGLPRLARPVYIGNMVAGSIFINDLEQAIQFGEVIDFSKLPAKRIAESRDLRGLLLQKHLKFCTEAEYIAFLDSVGSQLGVKHDSLPTGSREEMEALMETGMIPPELANRKGPKPIGITPDKREAEQIDLGDEGADAELDAELEIFQQISQSPTAPVSVAPRSKAPASSTAKSIRRVERE